MLYNAAPVELVQQFAALQRRAYQAGEPTQAQDPKPLHDPALSARSFYLQRDNRTVAYAGVVTKVIQHGDRPFTISGLSCVATDPDYQRQGLGRRVVAAATFFIEQSGVDFGVFTCAPYLTGFYFEAGYWQEAPQVVLLGSQNPEAITSEAIDVVVLLRLFSTRAKAETGNLLRGVIDLNLPVGQFW